MNNLKEKECKNLGCHNKPSKNRKECNPCRHKSKIYICNNCGLKKNNRSKLCIECSGVYGKKEKSITWKGGKSRHKAGYILVHCPGHARESSGYVFEHLLVMEEFLGRPVELIETVHHKNGIRDDNCLKNLELWTGNHPKGSRVSDLIDFANEIIGKYGNDSSKYAGLA